MLKSYWTKILSIRADNLLLGKIKIVHIKMAIHCQQGRDTLRKGIYVFPNSIRLIG